MWNSKFFIGLLISFSTFVCDRFVSHPMVVRLFEDLVPERRDLTMFVSPSCSDLLFVISSKLHIFRSTIFAGRNVSEEFGNLSHQPRTRVGCLVQPIALG